MSLAAISSRTNSDETDEQLSIYVYGRPMRRSGVALLTARITEAFGPVARSVALAHMVSPFDLGIAVSLSITAGLGDMILDLGIQYSAVRQVGKNGDVLPTLHTLLLLRGLFLGIVMSGGASLIATLFQSPSLSAAFSLLGGIFVVRGFSHLGVLEAARRYSFSPGAKAVLLDQTIQTVVVISTAFVLRNYWCMLIGLYASAITYALSSHILSPQRWRPGWSAEAAREAIRFGIPLIPSGAAGALSQVGDRFTVGSLLGPAVLAYYSVTTTAAVLPRNVIIRFLSTLFTPFFVNDDRKDKRGVHALRDRWTAVLFSVAFFYSLGFLVFGGPLISIVFGRSYQPSQLFVSAVAIGGFLKFGQQYPIPPALALGDSRFILFVSLLNVLSLSLGLGMLWRWESLPIFVIGIAIGDIVAVIASIVRSIRKFHFAARAPITLLFGSAALLCTAAMLEQVLKMGLVGSLFLFLVCEAAFVVLLFIGLGSKSATTLRELVRAFGVSPIV